MSDEPMYTVPLPVTIGGSKITADRISGPPSKVYPLMRDLIASEEFVTEIEIDTDRSRVSGRVYHRDNPGHELTLTHNGRPGTWIFDKIIAFRVLSVQRKGELRPQT